MFILFGTTHKVKRQRALLDTFCYECKRVVAWDWMKTTEWLTAYFIALAPVGSRHFLCCGGCGTVLQLTPDELRGIQTLQSLLPADARSLHDHLVSRLEIQQLADKTDTQREYLKAQRQKIDPTLESSSSHAT
jgi:hypothetical protein